MPSPPINRSLVILVLLFGSHVQAQVRFEPGYFIDNKDQKIECSIQNQDWLRNPDSFTYQLPGESQAREAVIGEVKEFSVGQNTFFRLEVKMDTSSQEITKLSLSGDPEWATRTVFLKRIVNGTAKLYRYRDKTLELFFFAVNNLPIEQLVYKKMKVSGDDMKYNEGRLNIGYLENLLYKSQLLAQVTCGSSTPAARMPDYRQSALQNYFERFNACMGDEVVTKKRTSKSFSITAGWDAFGQLRMTNDQGTINIGDESDPGYHFGLAAELVLPFKNGKWSFMLEPAYQASAGSNSTRNHKSFEMPAGVRHYFFLKKENTALFLNGFLVLDLAIEYEAIGYDISEGFAGCAAFGGGFKFGRMSLEGRYYLRRTYGGPISLGFSKASLIAAFRLTK